VAALVLRLKTANSRNVENVNLFIIVVYNARNYTGLTTRFYVFLRKKTKHDATQKQKTKKSLPSSE
jgi:hypothetical protein